MPPRQVLCPLALRASSPSGGEGKRGLAPTHKTPAVKKKVSAIGVGCLPWADTNKEANPPEKTSMGDHIRDICRRRNGKHVWIYKMVRDSTKRVRLRAIAQEVTNPGGTEIPSSRGISKSPAVQRSGEACILQNAVQDTYTQKTNACGLQCDEEKQTLLLLADLTIWSCCSQLHESTIESN